MNAMLRYVILSALMVGILLVFLPANEFGPSVYIAEPQMGVSNLRIIQNDGQWDSRINFSVPLNGGEIYLENNRLTYALFHIPDHGHEQEAHRAPEDSLLRGHAFHVNFPGANELPSVVPTLMYPEYHNYYLGNDPSKWASGVPLFGTVTYQNLWQGVDFRLYGFGDALKYDFMLDAGVDPSVISIDYEGLSSLRLSNDTLYLGTSVREITEFPPVAYQEKNGRKVVVSCHYQLDGTILTYDFPEGYDQSLPLIIDPSVIFSTYTGSQSDNWGFTATYDTAGNAYAGGIQFGATSVFGGYPTVGAIQTTFQGGQSDATISKFNATGTQLIFSTYLGGSNDDQPHSLIVDNDDELVVFGRTKSTNFPTFNAYDGTQNGGWDFFVTKFTASGQALVGSTYIGGSGDDGLNVSDDFQTYGTTKYNYGDDSRGEVIVDGNNNVYVAAPTKSSNFPVTHGSGNSSGPQDGAVIRLSPGLNALTWSRLFGGTGTDAIHTIKLEPGTGRVLIAGGTNSVNLPVTPGAHQATNFGGLTDGFVAKLVPGTNTVERCTYLGTSAYDQVYLLDLDDDNFVYVAGQTTGAWPIVNPLSGAVYRNTNAKQFIVKLRNDLGGLEYSTTVGSANAQFPNISPTAFLVDQCENVYLTGWGGSTNSNTGSPNQGNTSNMAVTPDAFKSSTDGSDFYLIVLDRDVQNLVYGSYFGGNNANNGDHVDGGTSRFDKTGVVYHAVCASCGGTNAFPAQPGNVYSTTNNSNNCNLAVFKLAFDLSGLEANFVPRDLANNIIVNTEGCAPLVVKFDNQSFLGGNPGVTTWFWDFDDNGASSSLFEPTYTFLNAGTYEVMLIITDSSSCNIADTTYQTITVFPPPSVDAGPDQLVCERDTFTLQALLPGVSYRWSPSASFITSDTIANPSAVATATRNYILTLTDIQGCEAQDTVRVQVDTSLKVFGRQDTLICRGGSVRLNATSTNGILYNWTSLPGSSLSNPNITNPLASNVDTTTLFVVYSENALGCPNTDTVQVEVFEVFTLEDTSICNGDTIIMQTSNGVSFVWSPNNGTLSSTNISSPRAFPSVTTTYTVIGTSSEGCISNKDILVEVKEPPTAEAGPDDVICFGESIQLQGSGSIQFGWTPLGTLSNPTISNPVATPSTSTVYYLTVTDAEGCQGTDSVRIGVLPLPVVDAGDGATICEGEAFQLGATGAFFYQWTPGTTLSDPTIADPLAIPLGLTEYFVTGTDLNGCSNIDSVTIDVIIRPRTEIDGINRLCLGGEIELLASGGDYYVWNTGDTAEIIFVSPTQTTTYIATAYIGECAGFPDTLTIDQFFDYPTALFNADPLSGWAPQLVQFTNLSQGALTYEWNFGFSRAKSNEENPSFVYPARGEYVVQLIAFSPQGCPDTAYATLNLDNIALHVPSGFTPNGDGPNEDFQVGYFGIRDLSVRIYSRWGLKIFESDNKDFRWNGTYQGTPVPEGVYVYVIEAVGENDQVLLRNGTVTLIR
ncbi:MAG: PKD domain-containing protein [Bacteroidia bacterium]|nr:PKD domain-containing protein [Bacteroidia bacterium]